MFSRSLSFAPAARFHPELAISLNFPMKLRFSPKIPASFLVSPPMGKNVHGSGRRHDRMRAVSEHGLGRLLLRGAQFRERLV